MQKVERAVSFIEIPFGKDQKTEKLILVLGGSSTGGMSHQNQHFWPSHLQKKMPTIMCNLWLWEVQQLGILAKSYKIGC